jgi:hypothetical protein
MKGLQAEGCSKRLLIQLPLPAIVCQLHLRVDSLASLYRESLLYALKTVGIRVALAGLHQALKSSQRRTQFGNSLAHTSSANPAIWVSRRRGEVLAAGADFVSFGIGKESEESIRAMANKLLISWALCDAVWPPLRGRRALSCMVINVLKERTGLARAVEHYSARISSILCTTAEWNWPKKP